MWAAFQGAWVADATGIREAKPKEAARSRFSMAASWLLQLITGGTNAIFPLRRIVSHLPVAIATVEDVVLQFDASPWGAGATLKHKGVLREYWVYEWNAAEVAHFKPRIKTGVSDHMTFLGVGGVPDVLHHLEILVGNTPSDVSRGQYRLAPE